VDDDIAPAQRNVETLGLGERARLVRADAQTFLGAQRGRFSLIFCDPPYTLADRLQAPLDKLIPGRLDAGGTLVVESSKRAPLRLGLPLETERTYGDTRIGVYGAVDG
jgi:16S rRNA G966 N2-methylase RsmD